MVFTGATIIAFLVMIELTLREVLNSFQVCVKDVIVLSVCEFSDEIRAGWAYSQCSYVGTDKSLYCTNHYLANAFF